MVKTTQELDLCTPYTAWILQGIAGPLQHVKTDTFAIKCNLIKNECN